MRKKEKIKVDKKKIGMAMMEAEGYLEMMGRYEHLPSSTKWYLVVQAAAQLIYSEKKTTKERKRIARQAFWRALSGLRRTWKTLCKRNPPKTKRLSAVLRRVAAADYFSQRRFLILREADLPYQDIQNFLPFFPISQQPWPGEWDYGWEIPEDQLLKKFGDVETLALLALQENVFKHRSRHQYLEQQKLF
ncbi:MAG: hypothetical protein LWW94_03945 [Candidatus Desulfofervidaceae bacterium]|nr:hypothetical protein [Candidatus Desulfofervidaceae bacterium]